MFVTYFFTKRNSKSISYFWRFLQNLTLLIIALIASFSAESRIEPILIFYIVQLWLCTERIFIFLIIVFFNTYLCYFETILAYVFFGYLLQIMPKSGVILKGKHSLNKCRYICGVLDFFTANFILRIV